MTHTISIRPRVQGENVSETTIQHRLKAEGGHVYRWSSSPGEIYDAYAYPFHRIIYVVDGSATFHLENTGQQVTLYFGDRLDLPAGTIHSITVGPEGVACLEAHRHSQE